MMTRSFLYLIFILLFSLKSQANTLGYFDVFSNVVGFHHQTVNCFYQDEYGFIWMGTPHGLIKYDGNEYQAFNYLSGDSTSIIDNSVKIIHDDHQGNLWLGTEKGVSIYSLDQNTFSVINELNEKLKELGPIQTIYQLDKNTIWIVTSDAVLQISRAKNTNIVTQVKLDFLNQNQNLKDVYLTNNRYYVLTNSILYVLKKVQKEGGFTVIEEVKVADIDGSSFVDLLFNIEGTLSYVATEKGLVSFDLNWEIMQLLDYVTFETQDNPNPMVNKIVSDTLDNIWVATQYNGVIQYHLKTKKSTFFNNSNVKKQVPENGINDILIDELGVIWLATDYQGISILNPYKKPFHGISHDVSDPNSISSNFVKGMLIDSQKRVWVGSFKHGVSRSNEVFELENIDQLTFSREFSNRTVYSIKQYKHFVLLGTNRGLEVYDLKQEKYIDIEMFPRKLSTITVTEIIGGQLFVYSAKELFVYNIKEITSNGNLTLRFEKQEEHTNILRSLKNQSVNVFFNDGEKGILIGTEKGLFHVSKDFSKLTFYKSEEGRENSLGSDRVFTIYRDTFKQLWIGTFGAGLYKVIENEVKIDHFEKVTPFPDNVVYSIMEDKNNRLWISTDAGIVMYNAKEQLQKNYTVSDGILANNFRKNTFGKDQYGTMLMGGIKGIVIFNPMEIQEVLVAPQPQILRVKVKNEIIEPYQKYDETLILTEPIYKASEIVLPYTMNQLTLELGAINFGNRDNIKFAYRLNGIDKGWVIKEADQGYANYTKLPSGEYIFEVKTINSDGVESQQIKRLVIKVETPWYVTNYAIIAYVIIVLLIIFGIYKYLANMVSLEKRVLSEKKDKEHLIEINEAKLTFFTNISHEIRTPLTLILTPLERLTYDEKLHPDLKSFVKNININGQRLLNLTNSLIDFRKIGKGELELKCVQQDIVPFIQKTAEAFLGYAKDKKIDYSIRIEEKSAEGWFDKAVLERIIFNLLSNAFKYTKENGEIVFHMYLEKDFLKIDIRDTGVGISEEDQEQIFDIFYKGNHKPSKFGSSGIGLYLVKELIELHSGKIELKSKENDGSTFSITLPMGLSEKPEFQLEEVIETGKIEQKAPVDNSTKKKVLLVEDNEELLEMIYQLFQKEYTVYQAKNGVEGYKIALEKQPDIIITDVSMPKMNGYELADKLKNNSETSHVLIIFLTAMADLESQRMALEKGGQIHISKPFSPKILTLQVKNLILQTEKETKVLKKKIIMSPEKEKIQSKDEVFLEQINAALEEGYKDNNYSIEQLAESVNMSYIQFYRKFKTLTEINAKQYLREFRLKKAKEMIEKDPDLSVYDVMYNVGFNSHSYFTISFKKVYGVTPATLRNQLSKTES
ncbi:two-component regulator propeller domain-containing protein [Flammeovirga sp. EKP202]|uniref:hybrid sensor histidine kinase/response regulator transcription factor n=1 Tax=Flammeovirga sp. EKP202 TaxID=2770592 RepID=UPI00165F9EE7|nr:two-component regulator propeller domain-containing protein [Flammeovirga sp. EKP202]MBD0400638.1 response regulator [Flammeovirga sp. EKP202]